METKFITLTKKYEIGEVYINPILITMIDPNPDDGTLVYVMGGSSATVTETVEEIMKLINKASKYTITYDQPG